MSGAFKDAAQIFTNRRFVVDDKQRGAAGLLRIQSWNSGGGEIFGVGKYFRVFPKLGLRARGTKRDQRDDVSQWRFRSQDKTAGITRPIRTLAGSRVKSAWTRAPLFQFEGTRGE